MASPLAQASAQATAPEEAQAAPAPAPAPDPIQVYMAQAQKNRETLNSQIEKLKSSLDERTQYPFDPFYMRMAAEFGKPTKTGSFYEGLGNAATGAMDFYEKEHNKNIEINKQKLELLKAQAALDEQNNKFGLMQTYAKNKGLLPEGSSTPAGARLAGAEPAPQGAVPTIELPPGSVAPPNGKRITEQDIIAFGSVDKELGTFLTNLSKQQREAIISTPKGLFDTNTNQWVVKFSEEPKSYTLPFIGDKTVTDTQKARVQQITDRGEKEGWSQDKLKEELAKYYASQGWLRKTENGKPVIQTPEDFAQEQDTQKQRTTNKVKAEEEYQKKVRANAQSSPYLSQLSDQNISLATNPATKRVFGVLSDPTTGSAFLNLLRNGVRLPSGSIEIPGLEDFVRQTLPNATEMEMNAFRMAQQINSQFGMEFRGQLAGTGPVTDYEQRLASSLAPNISDTPATMVLKSEMLKQRGRFHEAIAKEYNAWSKKNPDKFSDDWTESKEYKKLLKDNDAYMKGLFDQFFPRHQSTQRGPLESQIR